MCSMKTLYTNLKFSYNKYLLFISILSWTFWKALVCNCDSLICLSVLTNVTLSVLVVLSAKINQHVSPTYFKNNLSYANLSFHTNSRLRFLAPTNLLGLQGMPDRHAGPRLLPASSLPAYGLSLSSDLDLWSYPSVFCHFQHQIQYLLWISIKSYTYFIF